VDSVEKEVRCEQGGLQKKVSNVRCTLPRSARVFVKTQVTLDTKPAGEKLKLQKPVMLVLK